MIVEGIPYHRFIVRYTLRTGQRRRLVRYSPGLPWVRTEVARELADRHGIEAIKPHSVRITYA